MSTYDGMEEEPRPALLLGESMPCRGPKNVAWSTAAFVWLLLSAGGLVNVLLELSESEFLDALRAFGFMWTTGFSGMFCAAQTTWGSPRVQRLIPGGRPPGL